MLFLLIRHHSIYLPPCLDNMADCQADSFKTIALVLFTVFHSPYSVPIVVSCLLAEHIAAFVLQLQHKGQLRIARMHQSQILGAAQGHSHYDLSKSLLVLHMQSQLIVPEIPIHQNLVGRVLRLEDGRGD